jgi:hypothetical protein
MYMKEKGARRLSQKLKMVYIFSKPSIPKHEVRKFLLSV